MRARALVTIAVRTDLGTSPHPRSAARRGRLARTSIALLGLLLVLTAGASGPGNAQSTSPVPMCQLLTQDEVAQIVEEPAVAPTGGSWGCQWDTADHLLSFTRYSSGDGYSFDSSWQSARQGTQAEVSGRRVIADAEGHLRIELDDDSYMEVWLGGSTASDKREKLLALAALVIPRLATLPPPPTPTPQPSFAGDPELAALMPSQVGGIPLTIQTLTWSEFLDLAPITPSADNMERIDTTLAAQGKTTDDVFLGLAYSQDPRIIIEAIRVKGGDVAPLIDQFGFLLPWDAIDPQEEPGQVAGKDVTVVSDAADAAAPKRYLYPKGEIEWAVEAAEPALTQIFEQLP